MEYEKYLPLGTILKLKNQEKKIMVTGFMAMPKNQNNIIYDYTGCLYPEGFLFPNNMLLFNHQDIEKIEHMGYSDNEEKGFKEVLKTIDQENK